MQIQIGHANRERDLATIQLPGDVQAGVWAHSHTGEDAVIMARHVPIVSHYAQRNTVWFPPTANPQMLVDGIQLYKVDYLIVVVRGDSYYVPRDEDSFAFLYKSHSDKLHLVHDASELKSYQVIVRTVQTQ